MHILLTDVLTCPRCGPEFGLIVLSDRMEGRRVQEGRLGCANCREQYPLRGGVADLRAPGGDAGEPAPDPAPASAEEAQEGAVRLAALLGLADASGPVLVDGPGAKLAPAVAALVPGVEVVARTPSPPPPAADGPEGGVTRMAGAGPLPFRGGSLRGVALTGGAGPALLAEAVRVAAPGARIVVDPAQPDAHEALAAAGAEILLAQEGVVVARAGA